MNNLQLACKMYNEDWLASLPENPPVVEFSKRHQRKMKKLFDKMRGNSYHHFTRKTMVVMAAAALLMTMSVCAFANPEIRAYVLDELQDHAIFQSLFESEQTVDGKIECGYVPDGFEVITEKYSNSQCLIIFESNNNLHFSIAKMENGDEVGVDNKYTQKSVIQISNAELIIYEKDNGDIRAVWCNANYTYRLDGNISYDEVVKIAENVK